MNVPRFSNTQLYVFVWMESNAESECLWNILGLLLAFPVLSFGLWRGLTYGLTPRHCIHIASDAVEQSFFFFFSHLLTTPKPSHEYICANKLLYYMYIQLASTSLLQM